MRIVCPACAAAYEVPGARVLPGRVVRCARCETDWTPLPAADAEPDAPPGPLVAERAAPREPEPEPQPEPEPALEDEPEIAAEPEPVISAPVVAADHRFERSVRTKYVVALRMSWVLSVAALVAAGWFGYAARETIMHAWPPSIRAYAALGLAGRH